MYLIEAIENIKEPFNNAVLTIGNFDGVHIGHQALFHEVIEKAEALGGKAVAMTFEPHPIRVLSKTGHPPLITLHEQKVELIARSGIDVLISMPFTKEFASISAQTFLEDILIRRIGMKAIVVGEDYAFGKNREGNLSFLKAQSDRFGFEVLVSNWIQSADLAGDRISSTRIRELVMNGEMKKARKMLGRHYQIRGHVEKGRDRGGKLLGCPTANIGLQDELAPKPGVYAVTVTCKETKYNGVANIGYSPTFDDHIFTVEVHIFDFCNDIYGEKIRVDFIDRIRDEKKFSSLIELSEQIQKDILQAREILSA